MFNRSRWAKNCTVNPTVLYLLLWCVFTIQAGENGWTILYADSSSEYKDEVDTTDNNFKKAMEVLKTHFVDINKKV